MFRKQVIKPGTTLTLCEGVKLRKARGPLVYIAIYGDPEILCKHDLMHVDPRKFPAVSPLKLCKLLLGSPYYTTSIQNGVSGFPLPLLLGKRRNLPAGVEDPSWDSCVLRPQQQVRIVCCKHFKTSLGMLYGFVVFLFRNGNTSINGSSGSSDGASASGSDSGSSSGSTSFESVCVCVYSSVPVDIFCKFTPT